MEARIAKGEYVQVAPSILGELYATAPEGYATEGVSVMAVLAEAMPLFRALPFKSIGSIFVVPPDWETWQHRLEHHGFTPEQRKKRLSEARRSLQFALEDGATQLILNKDVAQATDDFVTLALGQPLTSRLQTDQAKARAVVRDLIEKLGKAKLA
jgi:guanylate kinase